MRPVNQEAQLLLIKRAAFIQDATFFYMLFYRILDLEILETAKMTFKSFRVIRNDTFR